MFEIGIILFGIAMISLKWYVGARLGWVRMFGFSLAMAYGIILAIPIVFGEDVSESLYWVYDHSPELYPVHFYLGWDQASGASLLAYHLFCIFAGLLIFLFPTDGKRSNGNERDEESDGQI